MPSLAELEAIRANAFADDLEIEDEMLEWTEAAAQAYFETGGIARPKTDGVANGIESPTDAVLDGVSTGDVVALGGVWAKVSHHTMSPHLVPYLCSAPGVDTPVGLGSQSSLGALRWLMMQIAIGQDALLLADPGPRPRQLVAWLCALLGRELEPGLL